MAQQVVTLLWQKNLTWLLNKKIMAKSIDDFQNLITAVHGSYTPEAVSYWQTRMRNENWDWGKVGGTMAYYKRDGVKVGDYGTTKRFPQPELVQSAVNKEILVKQSPVTFAGVKPSPSILAPMITMNEPNIFSKKEIGGGLEFGNESIKNLYLPFAVIGAVILAVFALRPKRKRRR
jgi:hypothetical protein